MKKGDKIVCIKHYQKQLKFKTPNYGQILTIAKVVRRDFSEGLWIRTKEMGEIALHSNGFIPLDTIINSEIRPISFEGAGYKIETINQ